MIPKTAIVAASLTVLLAAVCAAGEGGATGSERLKNRPVLDRPLTGRKLVIAHYMTDMLYYRGVRPSDIWNPDMYSPGGPAARVGGLIQFYPMTAGFRTSRSLEESVAFEMKAARRLGVDGFQFYYPCVRSDAFLRRYGTIIRTFFRVAARQKLDFKLTLCLALADGGTQKQKTDLWARHIRELLKEHRDSPSWLRTPDGRVVVFHWCADALTDKLAHHWQVRKDPKHVADVAAAYEQLARAVGLDIAWVYHLRWPKDRAHLHAVLDYFPAVWGWTDSYAADDGWEQVAAACKARKRDYTQTVYPDYYTSKVYPRRKGATLLFHLKDVRRIGRANLERQTQVCGLSLLWRRLLARAVRTDASMINLATWNDYPEGHHLAPEVNHNFAFALLLRHYKDAWRGRAAEAPREWAAVFYKKYRHDADVQPYAFAVRVKRAIGPAACEDAIEAVTRLAAPAEVIVNGRPCGRVRAGLVATTAPMQPGPVRVLVRREGKTVLDLRPPEWITTRPYRTDRLTYAYSTEFGRIHRDLFGRERPFVSNEYAEGASGIPNWRMRVRPTTQPHRPKPKDMP